MRMPSIGRVNLNTLHILHMSDECLLANRPFGGARKERRAVIYKMEGLQSRVEGLRSSRGTRVA